MLVEINLLPQKQKKSIFIYLLVGLISLAFLIAIVLGFIFYQSKAQVLDAVEKEIEFTVALREIEEKKLEEEQALDGFDELIAKIDWITEQRISLVFLLNHLVSLLPERGFFMNYQYSDEGTVSINVQFDTAREAANYLFELNQSAYITKATLQNLNTQEIIAEETDEQFDYLPRYIANYSITIDRQAVKQEEKKEE